MNQLFRPIQVIGAIIFGFQSPKQCIVFQPMSLLCAENADGPRSPTFFDQFRDSQDVRFIEGPVK